MRLAGCRQPRPYPYRNRLCVAGDGLPKPTREHYIVRFRKFINGWKARGYEIIPDEAPPELEAKCWAPSWRRMCKVLLRNDWWCKGLGLTQPKSEAYQRFREMKRQAGTT